MKLEEGYPSVHCHSQLFCRFEIFQYKQAIACSSLCFWIGSVREKISINCLIQNIRENNQLKFSSKLFSCFLHIDAEMCSLNSLHLWDLCTWGNLGEPSIEGQGFCWLCSLCLTGCSPLPFHHCPHWVSLHLKGREQCAPEPGLAGARLDGEKQQTRPGQARAQLAAIVGTGTGAA